MVAEYKPLYTVKEVSQVLQTNVSFVYQLIKNGELPSLKINNVKKIRGSDLERFIENYPIDEA